MAEQEQNVDNTIEPLTKLAGELDRLEKKINVLQDKLNSKNEQINNLLEANRKLLGELSKPHEPPTSPPVITTADDVVIKSFKKTLNIGD